MTRSEYRHAAMRLSAVERRAWREGSIEITSPDGRWVLTDLGMRRLCALGLLTLLCAVMLLAWVMP